MGGGNVVGEPGTSQDAGDGDLGDTVDGQNPA